MTQEDATDYGQEQTSFGSRETGLAAVFTAAPEQVFAAMEAAAERQGLAILMASQANGLLVARPRRSLLNLGRRVTVTFSPAGEGRTLAKAAYTHGLVSFQDRYQRLELLSDLLRSARNQLAAGQAAREAAAPAEQPEAPAGPAGQKTTDTPSGQAPAASAAVEAPSPQAPAGGDQPPQPPPTLREIKARARAEELNRMRAAGQDPEAAAFLKEEPEGFRLPRQLKARRFFWFALGVILAVVLVALMRLASG